MSSEDEQISIASWLLDYSILLVPEVVDEMGIDCFFTLADGYTFDDVRNALDEIYAGSTTLVYVESIEGYMDNISNNAEKKGNVGIISVCDCNYMPDSFLFPDEYCFVAEKKSMVCCLHADYRIEIL